MVWKHNGRVIQVGQSWISDTNYKYPRQWNNLSDAQKKAAGLVWEKDPIRETFDDRFYVSKDLEKKLEDEKAVNGEGKAIIDPSTGEQRIELGLKSTYIAQTKKITNDLLSKSDWEVTRKAEKGTAIASATSTYRDKVRTACDTIETKIKNCSNLKEFMALFDSPTDSKGEVNGKPPIYDFPDES
tara:strand:+ start:213 stop:767 length:555 start_codon:yes stop_codon:yes gene_type:complete